MSATADDMKARFARNDELLQLTDTEGAGVIDDAKLLTALTDADEEIDSYLAGTYDLPLTSVPARLKTLACDIARYNLFADAPPEAVQTRYDGALDWLKLVAKGIVKLSDNAGEEPVAQPDTIEVMPSIIAGRRDRMGGF